MMPSGKSLWMQLIAVFACFALSGCALEPLAPERSDDETSAIGEAENSFGEEFDTEENQGIDTDEGSDPEPNPWRPKQVFQSSSDPGPDPVIMLNTAPKTPSKKHDE